MQKLVRERWIVFWSCLMLGACASLELPRITAGVDSEVSVRQKVGKPTDSWQNADGTRTLEYSGQPQLDWVYLFTVDSQGRVIKAVQAMQADNVAKLEVGMSMENVRRLLGNPRRKDSAGWLADEVWEWNLENLDARNDRRLDVYFTKGRVLRFNKRDTENLVCVWGECWSN